jgi:hypothetical protein
MYLAKLKDKKNGYRYMIRQSYADGHCYRSRDLFNLGDDPARYIKYPGGIGFYIDTDVQDAIADQGVVVSQDDLEPIFKPFLDPRIRRVIDGLASRAHTREPADECVPADRFHPFDRNRLHYLKLGRVDRRDMACTPDRFYAGLAHKSRDEIEYDFTAAERILKPAELTHYTYQIFELQRYFSEHYARSHPEGLDTDSMDRFFIRQLCRLNRDESFWSGSGKATGLRQHLVRYVIMYFDYGFPSRDPFLDYLRDFIDRHRTHRPPKSIQVSLAESARLFGLTVDELKSMDCRALRRQYRKRALRYHPDKGGNADSFVKLSAAYHKLLKRKSGY